MDEVKQQPNYEVIINSLASLSATADRFENLLDSFGGEESDKRTDENERPTGNIVAVWKTTANKVNQVTDRIQVQVDRLENMFY